MAYSYEPLSRNYGLLGGIVVYSFELLGFPGVCQSGLLNLVFGIG